jgi:hypothetical protein
MAKGKYQRWLTPEGLLLIEGWARDGLTDEEIAKNMGINVATLYRWQHSYCEICEAIKKNKEVADREVEQALFRKATGYKAKEVIREKQWNRTTGQYEMVTVKEVEKDVAPDTTAQIFWLKNRKPDQWRDKREVLTENSSELSKIDDLTCKVFSADDDRDLGAFLGEGDTHE